jgi:LPXTG-motif cell wall-anchored protein
VRLTLPPTTVTLPPTTVAVVGTTPTFTLPETGADLSAVLAGYGLGCILGGLFLIAYVRNNRRHGR